MFRFKGAAVMIRKFMLIALMLAVSASVDAEVFRCKGAEGIVYSERPCASDASVVKQLAKKPSAENAREAQSRAERNQRQVEEKERMENLERQTSQARRPYYIGR
jgi:hypothetical protein